MALSSSNAVRQLSDGNSQGTVLGQDSSDLIGFYGVSSPIARPDFTSTAATITIAAQSASTAGQGFSTAAMFGAYMSTVVNLQTDMASIRSALVNLGLVTD